MKKGILTPFGEIEVYIDGVRSDYEYQPYDKDMMPLREKPSAGCYRIVITRDDWQTIRCVAALCDPELPNDGASGERYRYAEFVKGSTILTIGAGDEIPEFDTNQIRYGIEYVRRKAVQQVLFGVAWATDYEGPGDIRTELATDLY